MGFDPRSAESQARRQARRQLGRARRTGRALRNFYVASAALWCVLFVLATGTWKIVFGATFLVLVVGSIQVVKRPAPWTAIIAALWTAVAALPLFGVPFTGYAHILSIVWALACWAMLPTARRAQRRVLEEASASRVRPNF